MASNEQRRIKTFPDRGQLYLANIVPFETDAPLLGSRGQLYLANIVPFETDAPLLGSRGGLAWEGPMSGLTAIWRTGQANEGLSRGPGTQGASIRKDLGGVFCIS